jgi:hypothetical protein
MVKDIWSGANSGVYTLPRLTCADNMLFFRAEEDTHGLELWVSRFEYSDLLSDGSIDPGDFAVLAQHWRQNDCNEMNSWCGWADINRNSTVDLADLAEMTDIWLKW